jgi:hypothetical protein
VKSFDKLIELANTYYDEAETCASAGAHVAACVMLGAALEASLLGLALCLPDDLQQSAVAPRYKGGKLRPPEKWSLRELLDVAKERAWLPGGLAPDLDTTVEDALDAGYIGDCAEIVQETRNLLHPGKHTREYVHVTLGPHHYDQSRRIVEDAFAYLRHRLETEFAKHMPEQDDEA